MCWTIASPVARRRAPLSDRDESRWAPTRLGGEAGVIRFLRCSGWGSAHHAAMESSPGVGPERNNLSRLWHVVTSENSAATFCSPRNKKRRQP